MSHSPRFALFGALTLCASVAFGAAPLKSFHMKLKFSQPSGKGPANVAEFWVSNGKSRIFIQDHVLINDGQNMISYALKDPKKQYMLVPDSPQMKGMTTEQIVKKYTEAPLLKKAKKTGQAKLLGHSANIFEAPKTPQGGPTKIWLTSDTGTPIPLKIEQTTPMGKSVQEVTLLEINPAIPDALFKTPAGYKKFAVPNRPPMPPGVKKGH